MPTVTPQWMLRRLASRAVRIVKRRAQESPVIAAYLQTTVPKAEAFMEAYDRCHKYEANWKKEMREGRGAVAALLKQIQAWIPLVGRDVPGFEGGSYGDRPRVPDDVIEDGTRLAAVIEEFRDAADQPLSYQKEALAGLGTALQAAAKEWGEAEASDHQYQVLFAAARASAEALQAELVPLRRTLMASVGRSDKDFQKLRAERAGLPDDDDDPNAPTPPAPVTPVTPVAPATPVTPGAGQPGG